MNATFFESRAAFRDWLAENHANADELWVGYYKADSERIGISYGESVEEAICFGWIDGLINGTDDERYKRRFTPRNPDSKWSKKNKERVEAMIDAGRMTPAGMEPVAAAKASGEWDDAYRLADDHEIPDELEEALRENETAWANFQSFSNTDQHAFIAAVEAAKTEETKTRRIKRTVELAADNLSAYDENNKRRLHLRTRYRRSRKYTFGWRATRTCRNDDGTGSHGWCSSVRSSNSPSLESRPRIKHYRRHHTRRDTVFTDKGGVHARR